MEGSRLPRPSSAHLAYLACCDRTEGGCVRSSSLPRRPAGGSPIVPPTPGVSGVVCSFLKLGGTPWGKRLGFSCKRPPFLSKVGHVAPPSGGTLLAWTRVFWAIALISRCDMGNGPPLHRVQSPLKDRTHRSSHESKRDAFRPRGVRHRPHVQGPRSPCRSAAGWHRRVHREHTDEPQVLLLPLPFWHPAQ